MGGCKCTFHECTNTTTIAQQSGELHRGQHFFHFPIKDPSRCIEWAIYSNNMDFLKLPIEKLKNKVVCDLHFTDECFMNPTRGKLNKTTAVPKIYISSDKTEINLLENPMDWVVTNKQIPSPALFRSNNKAIDLQETSSTFELIESPEPAPKKIKRESLNVTQTVRILNKSAPLSSMQKVLVVKQPLRAPAQIKNNKPLPTAAAAAAVIKTTKSPVTNKFNYTITELHEQLPTVQKITKQDIAEMPVITTETSDEYHEIIENTEEETVDCLQPIPEKSQSEDLKPFIIDSMKQIAELKKMLIEKQSAPPIPVTIPKAENSVIMQSHLNKVQLFSGIKRYLSPSMVALLRLELFSAPGREYKKDEKIICSELLNLGESTYDFLSDEWRLRLPSKSDVQQWAMESVDDDDDAS